MRVCTVVEYQKQKESEQKILINVLIIIRLVESNTEIFETGTDCIC